MENLYQFCMRSSSLSVIRDGDLSIFSFCFNGFRESSVIFTKPDNVCDDSISMHSRVAVCKGRIESREQLL